MIVLTPLDNGGHLHDPGHYPDGPTCWRCGADREGPRANLGLCGVCYNRWMDAGYPEPGPPDHRCGGRGWKMPVCLAEFAALDRPGQPGKSAELAQRFGVTRRTLSRWRREIEARRFSAALAAVTGRDRWRVQLRGMAQGRHDGTDPVTAVVAASTLDSAPGGARRVACFRA